MCLYHVSCGVPGYVPVLYVIYLHKLLVPLFPRGQYCDFPPIIFAQNHTDRPDVLNLSINKRACYFRPVLRPPRDHSHARPPQRLRVKLRHYYRRPLFKGHWRPFSMDTRESPSEFSPNMGELVSLSSLADFYISVKRGAPYCAKAR